ncbi:MAG: cation-translocating P-type ATPase [Bacilli bacterium]
MFETYSKKEVLSNLETSLNGLKTYEVNKRLKLNGYNELVKAQKTSFLKRFYLQVKSPLIIILLIASIISFILKEFFDATMILFIVVVNAIVGIIQEKKAEDSINSLKKLSSPHCNVLRDNSLKTISSRDLVKGDIVILKAGDIVPADLYILEANNLTVDESLLTGESTLVHKKEDVILTKNNKITDCHNLLFMTTSIMSGTCNGVVTKTGMDTEVGKIASIIQKEKNETPLTIRLNKLGKILGLLIILICILIFICGVAQNIDVVEMVLTSISLAVAAIPEGLPAIVTIVLALGTLRIARVNAIVRRMSSVESLGTVNIVCSDKTGTITENKLKVSDVFYKDRKIKINLKQEELINKTIYICNESYVDENGEIIGNAVDVCLMKYLRDIKYDTKDNIKIISKEPFSSQTKIASITILEHQNKIEYIKGAFEKIIMMCSHDFHNKNMSTTDKNIIINECQKLALEGKRIISLAIKKENKIIYVGTIAMQDRPRKGVKESIATFYKAGVETIMITGDHLNTAFAIANEVGITNDINQCITGKDLDLISDEELLKKINNIKVYSRVTPKDKVRIIETLRKSGKVVAMTGDGVNDAPSLKCADIGIAMGKNGTDVAKEASDIVLMDDHFSTIEKAIEEGRTIYENIKKATIFLLSSNFGEIFLMFISIALGLPVPLVAVAILWVNLLTDILPAIALGVDQKDPEVMTQPPRKVSESLFSHGGIKKSLLYGMVIGLISFIAYIIYPISIYGLSIDTFKNLKDIINQEDMLSICRTLSFTTLCLSQLIHMIGVSLGNNSFRKIFKNKNILIYISLIVGLILQFTIISVPFINKYFGTTSLEIKYIIFVLIFSIIPLFMHELLINNQKIKKNT